MSRTLMLVLWAWLLAAFANNPKSESQLYENRMGSDIPLVLQRAMVDGYALPTPNDCTGLLSDMQSWGCPLPGRPKRPPVAGQAED